MPAIFYLKDKTRRRWITTPARDLPCCRMSMKANANNRTKALSLKPPLWKREIEENVLSEESVRCFSGFKKLNEANCD